MNKIEITSIATKSYRVSEAFKTLRTNLQFSGSDIKSIAVSSCLQNEGKSLISVELAKSFSEIGKKVIVVDTDMRKSVISVRYKTSAENPVGLSQYLTNQATLEEVTYSTQYDNLDIVLAGLFPPNPVELLCSDKFKEFMEICREKYDYVIVDTPPLGLVIDAVVIAAQCDGTVLVITNGKIKFRSAMTIKKQFEKGNCKILGAIMNYTETARFSRKRYSYRYYYTHSEADRRTIPAFLKRIKREKKRSSKKSKVEK